MKIIIPSQHMEISSGIDLTVLVFHQARSQTFRKQKILITHARDFGKFLCSYRVVRGTLTREHFVRCFIFYLAWWSSRSEQDIFIIGSHIAIRNHNIWLILETTYVT